MYAYSTSHLTLGSCPEWEPTSRVRKSSTRSGVGPIYGFRHPELRTSSFYVKLAVRPATSAKSELLAVGSSSSCPVVFPAYERFLKQRRKIHDAVPTPHPYDAGAPPDSDELPIHSNGAALVNGHEKEVTGVTWTREGELLSISDDSVCRIWRDEPDLSRLQRQQEGFGTLRNGRGSAMAKVAEAHVWDDSE